MESLLLISLIILEAFIFILTFTVFRSDSRSVLNKSFVIFVLTLAVWLALSYLSNLVSLDHDLILLLNRLFFFWSVVTLLALYYFTEVVGGVRVASSKIFKFLLISVGITSLLSLTPFVVEDVHEQAGSVVAIVFGGLSVVYFIGLFSVTIATFIRLIKSSFVSDLHIRSYSRVLFISIGGALFFNLLANALLPIFVRDFMLSLYSPVVSTAIIVGVSYAIARHSLFDIKLAAVRSIAYLGLLLTLSGIYYLCAYLLSQLIFHGRVDHAVSISPINIILALFLALLFQPIKRFFDRITDSIFYRHAYKTEEFFADLSELLASTTDLRGVLQRASEKIGMTLKAEQCFFFLYYTNSSDHHLSSGTHKHARLPLYDARMLDSYLTSHDDALIMTNTLPEKSDVRRMLVSHKIELVMPLHHSGHVIGYVCLGDQQGSGYTKRDLNVLNTISNELVIAIQNALSVHEIKEINAHLEQEIKSATSELRESNAQLRRLDAAKDEFVSMASHQLRTPLTSIKGYISMMLEGDVGKITDQQRNALEEAFNSSERMVRLIGDFLSVSRLQTGKFIIDKKPTDIAKVVRQEVGGLRLIASTHGLKLAFKEPKNLPEMLVDEPKIRQVIMNFIDNAIYYSKPDTTIHVALGEIENDLFFTVEDSGIGVPQEQQAKLFSKFYRASNARQQRPDGTGVGLYLAKKVILAHDGKVVFSSVEGQGSTFGFRIPLAQKPSNPDDNQEQGK